MTIEEINELLGTSYTSKESFVENANWEEIAYFNKLSEEFIIEFKDKVDWDLECIFKYQSLSSKLREEFKHKLY